MSALLGTAGCSALFGFEDLLPLPQTPSDAGPSEGSIPTEAGADAACPVGFDDCDDEPGCETDVSGRDPKHCGACNRTCGGGTCSGGACTAEIIAMEDALAIATDREFVYWSTPAVDAGADAEPVGQVIRSSPDGGARTVMANAASLSGSGAIAVDDANVYWLTRTAKVGRAAKDGSQTQTFAVGAATGSPYRLAIAGDAAFVTVRQGGNGRVDAVPLSGAPAIILSKDLNQPAGIVAGPSYVSSAIAGAMTINETLVDGGSPTTLSSNAISPLYIATDGDRLYWTTAAANGGVWSAPRPLSQSTVVLLHQAPGVEGYGIAVDDKNVYWSTETAIHRVSKTGTKHAVLANLAGATAREIAIDEGWVYFVMTLPVGTRIGRTPK